MTREMLDGRSTSVKQFDAIASGIAKDLGGEDRLSVVQKHLVEAFAGIALIIGDNNVRLLLGQELDVLAHSNCISTMVRVATRLGTERLSRDVTPDPLTYAAQLEDAQP